MLQVAEFAELEVAEFAVLRRAQLSEKCLHNLLNTKPLYFSEREQYYGLWNEILAVK